MHSLKIEDQNEIFEIGVSGKNTDSLAGDGIGMHVIKKGLNIMNMDISIRDNGKLEKHKKFNKNCFVITTTI